jgi:REP element-mobilizing transposase RayT
LTARVHDGVHVYVFVSAKLSVCVASVVRVLKFVSVKLLFEEFLQFKLWFWGGHLWSEGYIIRTAGDVTIAKIEVYINRY